MTQDTIFSPFFATVFLTLLVWVYMYVRRISFLTSSKIPQVDLSVPGTLAQISPPNVSNPSDNLKNLFEIPVLFYALLLYLFVTKQVDTVYMNAAWVFVIFRALHSAVHCTFNLNHAAILPLSVRHSCSVVYRYPCSPYPLWHIRYAVMLT